LFDLVRQIKTIAPEKALIIVGSQAVHAVAPVLPEIVQRLIEYNCYPKILFEHH